MTRIGISLRKFLVMIPAVRARTTESALLVLSKALSTFVVLMISLSVR
jgi:hypothetical protein